MNPTLEPREADPRMKDSLTLKWGTLKAWEIHTPKAKKLLGKYWKLGHTVGVASQRDTPEQKELILQIIDACNCDGIWLDWDGKKVSKEEAKDYIRNYGLKQIWA